MIERSCEKSRLYYFLTITSGITTNSVCACVYVCVHLCLLRYMYQECSMRVTKVTDSLVFCNRLRAQAYLCKKCKQQYSMEALSGFSLNLKGITIFPYDNK